MKRNKLIVGIGLLLIGVFALYGFANAEMTYVTEWGSYGTGDGQFKYPRGIAVDSEGSIYVADSGISGDSNHRIQKLDDGVWTTLGSVFVFIRPCGIAVDSTGNVYVADEGASLIKKFYYDGIEWKWTTLSGASVNQPQGIAVDSTGNVYVSDTYNDRIRWFDGAVWTTLSLPSGYDRPSGIAVDSAGDVYVATRNYILLPNEYDIHKFDSSAATWTTWNTPSNPLTVLNDPRGLSVQYDLDGNIYICVADTYNDRILRFTTDGVYHDGWGSSGTGGGRFDLPFGIASDSDGNVYVADTENHRIQKFSLDPVALLQALVEKVLELDVKQGIMTSLDAKLENALDSLDAANADQRQDAINKLEAFKNAVEAQRDKELTSLQADELIAAADAIIALLQL